MQTLECVLEGIRPKKITREPAHVASNYTALMALCGTLILLAILAVPILTTLLSGWVLWKIGKEGVGMVLLTISGICALSGIVPSMLSALVRMFYWTQALPSYFWRYALDKSRSRRTNSPFLPAFVRDGLVSGSLPINPKAPPTNSSMDNEYSNLDSAVAYIENLLVHSITNRVEKSYNKIVKHQQKMVLESMKDDLNEIHFQRFDAPFNAEHNVEVVSQVRNRMEAYYDEVKRSPKNRKAREESPMKRVSFTYKLYTNAAYAMFLGAGIDSWTTVMYRMYILLLRNLGHPLRMLDYIGKIIKSMFVSFHKIGMPSYILKEFEVDPWQLQEVYRKVDSTMLDFYRSFSVYADWRIGENQI
jgi:hypothetical protein